MTEIPPPNPPYEPPESDSSSAGPAPEPLQPPLEGGAQPRGPDWRDSLGQAQDESRAEAREARRAARQARRQARGGSGWIAGVVLVVLGVVFLLQNLNGFIFTNWWALFLLIPAVGAFSNAWRAYQAEGRLAYRARGSLIVGIILTLVAGFFLLNLQSTLFWAVLLILGGVLMLFNGLLP